MGVGCLLAMGLLYLVQLLGWVGDREVSSSARYYRDVMNLVQDRYVNADAVQPAEMTRDALRGMLRSLDENSDFLAISDFEHLREDLESNFGGIGVQIEFRDGYVVVIAPIAGTPGERAGILRGDRVVEIDGQSMVGAGINEVVDLMRGAPGSEVTIAFDRPGEDELFEVTVVREVIEVESVANVEMVDDEIGYMRVVQFAEPTAREFKEAVSSLQNQGMEALVIDLRNNPGGILTVAKDMLEPFYPAGELMVYTEGREATDRKEFRSRNGEASWDFPVAILINGGSASASELMAGSLKDSGKATVIGEQSFGKGSVQTLISLKTGEAVRLTTALFYTPAGEPLHEVGVSPDIVAEMSPEDDYNLALQRNRPDLSDPEAFNERFGFYPVEDEPLKVAVTVLREQLGGIVDNDPRN